MRSTTRSAAICLALAPATAFLHSTPACLQQQRWRQSSRAIPTRHTCRSSLKMVTANKEKSEKMAKTDARDFPVLNVDPEDTGLKVTPNAWAWPNAWPYSGDYFSRENSEEDVLFYKEPSMEKLWEPEAEERVQSHLGKWLSQGSDVLELGAGAHSYLPSTLELRRHAAIGLNSQEMSANEALTETGIVQDLNTNPRLPFDDETFDSVIMCNTAEFFLEPRTVMRDVLRVLRPGGKCIIAFAGKEAYTQYGPKQIKVWKDMNDAQRMWIVGSYFKFSAGDGWEDLKGYDMSLPGPEANFMTKISGPPPTSKRGVMIVQAAKSEAARDPRSRILRQLQKTNSLDIDEMQLCVLRLMADYERAESSEAGEAIIASAAEMPTIYEVLGLIPPTVLIVPHRALLSTRLVTAGWNGCAEQMQALKEGLGLLPPSEIIWKPLGANTDKLDTEDKVLLLATLVPYFGNPANDQMLSEVAATMEKAVSIIRGKIAATEGDIQLLAIDLILTDFVPVGEKRSGFLSWLEGVSSGDLDKWLEERKTYKEVARLADEAANPPEAIAEAAEEPAL